jgi:hypothetical protein
VTRPHSSQPPVAEPDPRHRTRLLKLGTRQCRYIISDDPRRAICCGAPTSEGSSWCAWHRRLVYVPAQPVKVRLEALLSQASGPQKRRAT